MICPAVLGCSLRVPKYEDLLSIHIRLSMFCLIKDECCLYYICNNMICFHYFTFQSFLLVTYLF
uniref:Uncharacterized protein n=1 Tax=Picea glauca TaxID=3330 RepID=A0A101M4C7_PICGL|nr:hypothetical protein ABT39_MTgene614 [Picea glauca]